MNTASAKEQVRNMKLTNTKQESRLFEHYLVVYRRHKNSKRPAPAAQLHIMQCIRAGLDPLPGLGIQPDVDESPPCTPSNR